MKGEAGKRIYELSSEEIFIGASYGYYINKKNLEREANLSPTELIKAISANAIRHFGFFCFMLLF